MSAQLELWDPEMPEISERLARLESGSEALRETVDRNRAEEKQDRANLQRRLDRLEKMVEGIEHRLDKLFALLEQAKGAKRVIAAIVGIFTFFGFAGLYQVANWISAVRG